MVKKNETHGLEPTTPTLARTEPGFFSKIMTGIRSVFSGPISTPTISDGAVPNTAPTTLTAPIAEITPLNQKKDETNYPETIKFTRRISFRKRIAANRNNTKKHRVNASIHKGKVSDFSRMASTYESVDAIKDDPRLKILSWCRGARYDDFINELQKTFIKETIFNQDVLIETVDDKSIHAGIKFSDILTVRSGPLYLSAGNENKGRDVYEDDPILYQKKIEIACQKIKLSLINYAEYIAESEQHRKHQLNKSSSKMLQIIANELNNDMLQTLLSSTDFESVYAKFKDEIGKKYEFVTAEHEKIDWFFRTAIANTQKFLLPQLARKLSDFDLVMENEERLISALKVKIGELEPDISDSAIKRFAQSFWQLGTKLDLDILRQLTNDEKLSYTDAYIAKHRELCEGDKPSPETHTLITSTKSIIFKIIPQSLAEENVNPIQIDTSYGLGISYNGPEVITNPSVQSTRWSHHIFSEAKRKIEESIDNKDQIIMELIEQNISQRKENGETGMHASISATEQIKNEQISKYLVASGYSSEDSKRICQHKGIFEHGDVICDTFSYFAKYINNDNLFSSFLKSIELIIQKASISIEDKSFYIKKISEIAYKCGFDGMSVGSQMELILDYLNNQLKVEQTLNSVNECYMQYYQGLILYDNLALFEEAGKKWSQCQIFSPLHKREKYYGNMFDVAQAVVPSMMEIERKSEDLAHSTHRTSVIDDESKPYRSIDKMQEIIRLKAQIQVLKLCFRLDFVRFYLHRDYLLSDLAAAELHDNMNPDASAVLADIDKRTYLRRHLNEMIAHPEIYAKDRIEALEEVLKKHEEIVAAQLKYFNENYRTLIDLAYVMKAPDITDWDEDLELTITVRNAALTNPDFTDDFVLGMPHYNNLAPEITVDYLKKNCPDLVKMLGMYVSPINASDEKTKIKDPVDDVLEQMVVDFKKRIIVNYQFRDIFESRLAKNERTKINFPSASTKHRIESGMPSPVGNRIQPKTNYHKRSNSAPTLPSWNNKLKSADDSRKKNDIKTSEESPEKNSRNNPGSNDSKKP